VEKTMTDHQHTNEIIRENKTSESSADHDISTGENIPIPALSKSLSFPGVGSIAGSFIEQSRKAEDARPLLPRAAFFMGDMKDGLPMLNMQAVFLMSSKNFSEKQIGVLFLAFGLSQFLCMTPAGYFLDYSNHKIDWVNWSGLITSLLTVTTVITAHDGGSNMGLMILLKILQGGTSAILPPGFNSVTLGIVGSTGFTVQVAKNRTMNHVGTALIVAIGTLIAYLLYPNIGALFIVSPLTMIGVYHNMVRIKPNHINRDAARALIIESPTMTEYEHLEIKHTMGSHVNGMSYEGSEYTEADTTSFTDSSNQSNAYIPPTANTTVPVIDESPIVSVDANVTKSQEMVQLDNNNNNNNNNQSSYQTMTATTTHTSSRQHDDEASNDIDSRSHCEDRMACALALGSGSEFKFWFSMYVKILSLTGNESLLRLVIDMLLGKHQPGSLNGNGNGEEAAAAAAAPCTSTSWWLSESPNVLEFDKVGLVTTVVIPEMSKNRALQRITNEIAVEVEMLQKE